MTGIGSSNLAAYREGGDLSAGQSIKAKCADCMADYADGRLSCDMPDCPLWPFMPYNPNKKRRSNPSRIGLRPGEISSNGVSNDGAMEIVEDGPEVV